MSYQVDLETLLFSDLDQHDAIELELLVMRICLDGKADLNHAAFLQWCAAGKYDDRRALLVHTTVFPVHALLSALRYWRYAQKTRHSEG